MSYKDNWVLNLNKLDDSEWILKLLSLSNNKNMDKYLDTNKNMLFYSDSLFYKSIKNNILEIIDKDPIDLISDLVKLRADTEEEISYLNKFMSKHNENVIRQIIRGIDINSNVDFINYGLFIKSSVDVINFNKKIKTNIMNISNSQNISNIEKKSLIQSVRSGTGWFYLDYKKHALGSMSDIIELVLNLIQYGNTSNIDKQKESIQFLVDIFQIYFEKDDIEELIVNIFFSQFTFEIPTWRTNFKNIIKQQVDICGSDKETDVKQVLNNLLNEFNMSIENGVSESIIILFYNMFENVLFKFKALYNEIYSRINQSSLDEKQKKLVKLSIKDSIDSLELIVKEQIQYYFNINHLDSKFGFEKTNNEDLYPEIVSKNAISSKNIYRIIGGIQSINRKENCLKKNFPIKFLYNSNGTINGIEIEESKQNIIHMLIQKRPTYSMGGFVLKSNIYLKSFDILKKYIENVTKSKIDSIKLIDNEFKKMIKGIKLKKIASLSKSIQEDYKKIILEKDPVVKKLKLNELSDNYISQYKREQNKLITIINDIKDESKLLRRNRTNVNKAKQKLLKKISHHHKILTNKYFVVKNYNYVFKLLTVKIYESIQNIYQSRTTKNIENILPSMFIKLLNKGYEEIDSNFERQKNKYTVSNLNKLRKSIGGKGNIYDWLKDDSKNNIGNKIILKKNVRNQITTRPLNRINHTNSHTNKLNIPNKVTDIEYWQAIDEKLLDKDIFMIYTAHKKKTKGFFNMLYGTLEGELNNSKKYTMTLNKKSFLEEIPNNGLIIVCSKTSELNNPKQWRLFKKSTIDNLKTKSATNIRKKMYSILNSQSEFMKNTYVWGSKLLSYEKQFLLNICSFYNNNLNNCQVIISREELVKFIQ